jgi:hypothetical protein
VTNSEVDRLIGMVDHENPFDMPFSDVLPRQLAAVNERFQSRVDKIRLLQSRAEEGGITEVRRLEDIVPLLFAHTAYKSYPENWLMENKWDRLGKWLDTVSTHRVKPMDTSVVQDLDDWLHRLEEQGHYVSCSSGTTGKCAMMNATPADLQYAGRALLHGLLWAGLQPSKDRLMITCGQFPTSPRNAAAGRPMAEALSDPAIPPFRANASPLTIGSITEMIVLRKRIADGTARAADIEQYEAKAAERARSAASVIEQAADAIIANRGRKLHIIGFLGSMYQVAALVRERGYCSKDFAENSTFISGGLKRAQVPDNYQEIIFDTLNLPLERRFGAYGMQELNTNAMRCRYSRYHLAPWVMLLLLDESGEKLMPLPASGEIEGRAAFFDLSLAGRWGGIISGDKIRATREPCACGNRSPSINPDIQRYADMAGGDKISCAGTIDAYVRGVI